MRAFLSNIGFVLFSLKDCSLGKAEENNSKKGIVTIMKTLLQLLSEKTSIAFARCGYSPEYGALKESDRPDLCQFQCNGAFAAAKVYKKPPLVIASQAAAALEGDGVFRDITVAGAGFLNLSVSDDFLLCYVHAVSTDRYKGIPQAEIPETIFLDYGGPNVAKPLHIGHLRSAVIGEALKRIVRATGRKAISDVHLGDWGLQIGLVIAELQERYYTWDCFSETFDLDRHTLPQLTALDLNEIYPFASKKSKTDEEFRQRAKSITAQLQKGHPGYTALWKAIISASVEDMKKNYERLQVSFDCWYGESDAEKDIPELLERLKRQNLLVESEGALVVDVSEETDKAPIPPVIIKKTDDSSIYATTDLATIIQRVRGFHPQRIWYIVDSRQSLHFTQVFRCAKKAGLAEGTSLEHLGFGTMNGEDGKPYKTRDGGVMRLSELYDTVYEAALRRVGDSEFSAVQDKADIAGKLTVAAIKFGDLVNHRLKDYVFDLDKFLAAEGKTGSFLLYTVSRINSILLKLPPEECGLRPGGRIYSDAQRELTLKIARSNEAFLSAFAERAPSAVCENAYQLASAFSKFYHTHHILSEGDREKKAAWVTLCVETRQMLLKHLEVLGIEAVELM